MCYSDNLQHKGIKIVISDCFGVGFDWNDPKLIEAIEKRDVAIWEIFDWIKSGGAEKYNAAQQFESDCISYKSLGSMYSAIQQYDLVEVVNNQYLSARAQKVLNSFLDGSMKTEVLKIKAEERARPKEKKGGIRGSVYLILAENGLYKIGKAKNVTTRMQPFSVHFPMAWELVHSFRSNDYDGAEKHLHNKYAEFRKVGEWFSLSDKQKGEITSIKDYEL